MSARVSKYFFRASARIAKPIAICVLIISIIVSSAQDNFTCKPQESTRGFRRKKDYSQFEVTAAKPVSQINSRSKQLTGMYVKIVTVLARVALVQMLTNVQAVFQTLTIISLRILTIQILLMANKKVDAGHASPIKNLSLKGKGVHSVFFVMHE